MVRKMHDILPPKRIKKAESTAKSLSSNKKRKTKNTQLPYSEIKNAEPKYTETKPVETKYPKKKSHFPLRGVLIGSAIVVVLLSIYAYIKLPKADIEIWPKTDTLTLQEKITADKSANSLDLLNNVIPAQYMEVQNNGAQQFPATGSASNDGKATGTVKVYNKIDSLTAFTLVKGTHFLSDSGKYFVTLAKVVIPAAQNKNGKLIAASVDAQVQAEESGADYNIGPSKFSVPKLYGTSYYYSVYAESNSSMTGGYTGRVKKVTSDDIQTAKDILTKKLLTDAQNSLRGKLAADDVLLDGAMANNIVDTSSDVKPDAIADTFNESATVKISALVFKKQDIEKLVKNNILLQLSKDNNFLEKSLSITYNLVSLDIKGGKLALNLQSSVKTYYQINTNDLVYSFSTKSGDQIKQIVDQMYNGKVSELKVNFWPFWVHKAPEDKSRIKVNLNF